MVHMASVWVPFTSESKEAVAGYPEIQKELRLGLQAVGRKLAMYLRRRVRVKQEGHRRTLFLRYLGEVARAVSDINQGRLRKALRTAVEGGQAPKRPRPTCNSTTAAAWLKRVKTTCGDNVLIVPPAGAPQPAQAS